MHDSNQQKNMSPVAAGITGLIVGIVGTAAVALSDKTVREKVTKKANKMRDNLEQWSKDTLHDMGSRYDAGEKTASDTKDDLKTIADDTLKEDRKKEL